MNRGHKYPRQSVISYGSPAEKVRHTAPSVNAPPPGIDHSLNTRGKLRAAFGIDRRPAERPLLGR